MMFGKGSSLPRRTPGPAPGTAHDKNPPNCPLRRRPTGHQRCIRLQASLHQHNRGHAHEAVDPGDRRRRIHRLARLQGAGAAGYRPVVFDNLSRGHREAVRWGPLLKGDLADHSCLRAGHLAEHRVVAVMHFAAFAYVGESVADPAIYYRNNVVGTLSLLDAMREAGVERIGLFLDLCHLRHARGGPDRRERAAPSGQSLW